MTWGLGIAQSLGNLELPVSVLDEFGAGVYPAKIVKNSNKLQKSGECMDRRFYP